MKELLSKTYLGNLGSLGNNGSSGLGSNDNYHTIILAALFGVFIRQIYVKKGSILQRILEYIAGALCSVYGADLLAHMLYQLLLHYHFIPPAQLMPQSLVSLSAFLCGMFGLSLCELGFCYIFCHIYKLKHTQPAHSVSVQPQSEAGPHEL